MASHHRRQQPGRLLIFTGNGKGKTTAALGVALRATGHGMRVMFIQFIKARTGGEHAAAKKLGPGLKIKVCGTGFLDENSPENMRQAAQKAGEGLEMAESALKDPQYDIVVLDEVLLALSKDLLEISELRRVLKARRAEVHVILTGRGDPSPLAEMADTITRMDSAKHAFEAGRKSTKGIEF